MRAPPGRRPPASGAPRQLRGGGGTPQVVFAWASLRARAVARTRTCGVVRNSCTHYVPIAHSSKYEHAWLMLRESFGFLEPPASSANRLSWQVT